MKTALIAGTILAALALAGCREDEMALENTAWLVEEIAGARMQAPVPTLEFRPDGRVGGKASCNNYGGAYKVDDGRIEFGPMVATKMACPEPMMSQEHALLSALQGKLAYAVNGAMLTIDGAEGRKVVARRVLANKS